MPEAVDSQFRLYARQKRKYFPCRSAAFRWKWFRGLQPRYHGALIRKTGFTGMKALVGFRLKGLVIYSPRVLIRNSRTQEVCTNARYPQTNSSKFQQIPTAYCRRPLNPQSELRIDAPAAICFTLPPMSPSSHMSGRHPIRLMRSGVPRRASENQDALD